MSRNRDFRERLRFALAGLSHAIRSQRSMRTHAIAFALLMAGLLVLRPAALWWAAFLLAGFAVLCAEMLNTAIEQLADLLHPEQHPQIRIVKDCAAGAVLMATLAALGVAAAFLFQLLVH
ncbi:MAG: hypothetical protein RL030_186 [Pseudomonadota bacterium]|jgi:diacylglycerol kinase (ATP)